MGRKTKQSSSSFWYSLTRSSSAPTTPRPEPATAATGGGGEPPFGCMSMVHYLIFAPGAGCVGRPPTASSNGAIVTPHDCHGGHHRRDGDGESIQKTGSGFEAPRNSLDLDADNPNDIQIGVQIEPVFDALASSRTSSMRRSTKATAPSSEAETPRTPSLVARLMGIDGLPEQQPPSPSMAPAQHKKPGTGRRSTTTTAAAAGKENTSSSCNCSPPQQSKGEEEKNRVIPESMTMNRRRDREPLRTLSCNVNAGNVMETSRSLPDTPRASTSARASWDGVVPRPSLQALRDNVLDRAAQYTSMPSSPTSLSSSGDRKKKKQNRDGSRRGREERAAAAAAKEEHAREILRQAKETVASRKQPGSSSVKSKNSSAASSSPAPEKKRLHSSFFDNNKENVVVMREDDKLPVAGKPAKQSSEHQGHIPRVALAPRRQHHQQQQHQSSPSPPPPPLDPPPPTRARKPDGCERFATRAKKPPSAAACQAAIAPTASTSSSSLPSTTTTTDLSTSAAASTARARASSSSPPPPPQENEDQPEYRYLRSVLERGGFMRPPPPHRWRGHCGGYSSSVAAASWPVDPIVFHLLELELPVDESESRSRMGALRHRWNRKLLFHLAQELLADHIDASASSSPPSTIETGPPLLGQVWREVRSFPAADCRVVGDIDALVAADLTQEDRRPSAEEEEARGVAAEVADHVLDALLAESAVSLSS